MLHWACWKGRTCSLRSTQADTSEAAKETAETEVSALEAIVGKYNMSEGDKKGTCSVVQLALSPASTLHLHAAPLALQRSSSGATATSSRRLFAMHAQALAPASMAAVSRSRAS